METKKEVIEQLERILNCLRESDNDNVEIKNGYNDRVVDMSYSNDNGIDVIHMEEVPQD